MAAERKPHVLVVAEDPAIGHLVQAVIEEELEYTVTAVCGAVGAFVRARASLYPLVVVIDQTSLRMYAEGFAHLFTNHADLLPPMAWVALLCRPDQPEPIPAFLASKDANVVPLPLNLDMLLAAVERAAGRVARYEEVARP